MRAAAAEVVRDAPAAVHAEIVAVGGTASNLLKVLSFRSPDRTLTREDLAEAQAILATEPAAAAAQRHLVNPIRARILPAGGAIMDAILEHYGASRIRISEAGLREGSILVVEHAGQAWRDRLAGLAQGWRA
jgi:exopolyphosphatase/pppGpp-phosphohydrolase